MVPAETSTRVAQVVSQATRMLPSLREVRDTFLADASEVMGRLFPRADAGTRAIVGAGGRLEGIDVSDLERTLREAREKVVRAGLAGIEKIQKVGNGATLDPVEVAGLEVVLLLARPAIEFQDGHFLPPGPPWRSLEDHRAHIEAAAAAVGRIQVQGHRGRRWAGTGFLVGDGVVMTNAHVAEVFATATGLRPGVSASIDWADDPDLDESRDARVTEIIGVHDRFDLALLRVTPPPGGDPLPKSLLVATAPPDPVAGRSVYVLGYPAFDRRNGGEAQRLIFGDKYDVKRLQPGEVLRRSAEPGWFDHDCSTLGGNSGSCVVDLATRRVIGVHFQGEYMRYNQAVALWDLAADPLLERAGVLTR